MIKKIEEVPKTVSGARATRRAMLRSDIREAIANRIAKFEFEGDYNYKYLANYAKEEANRVFQEDFFYVHSKGIRADVQAQYPDAYLYVSPWDYTKKWFKVHSKKGEDRVHVYAEIDFNYLDKFPELLYADYCKAAQRSLEIKRVTH